MAKNAHFYAARVDVWGIFDLIITIHDNLTSRIWLPLVNIDPYEHRLVNVQCLTYCVTTTGGTQCSDQPWNGKKRKIDP